MPILNVENIASTTEITENGLHDVAQYTTADVNVSPSITSLNVTPTTSAQTITAPAGTDGYSPVNVSAVTSSIDANIQAGNIKDGVTILGVTGNYQGGGGTQMPGLILSGTVTAGGTMSSVSTVKLVGVRYLDGETIFNGVGGTGNLPAYLDSVDMSVLEGIESSAISAFGGAFSTCDMLESADLSSLQYINGDNACDNMFGYSTSLSNVNLSSLRSIGGSYACSSMFDNCSSLGTVRLPLLQSITGEMACFCMFQDCSGLSTVQLPILQTITGQGACQSMFQNCELLDSISFPALTSSSFGNEYTDQFVDMFNGCANLTEIHFPSNVQSVIEGLDDYNRNFGANPNTIYFDLPATE